MAHEGDPRYEQTPIWYQARIIELEAERDKALQQTVHDEGTIARLESEVDELETRLEDLIKTSKEYAYEHEAQVDALRLKVANVREIARDSLEHDAFPPACLRLLEKIYQAAREPTPS